MCIVHEMKFGAKKKMKDTNKKRKYMGCDRKKNDE